MRTRIRAGLLLSSSMLALITASDWSLAQEELPEVKVEAPKEEAPKPPAKPAVAAKPAQRQEAVAPRRVTAPKPAVASKPAAAPIRVAQPVAAPPPPSPEQIAAQAAERVIQQTRAFDQQRDFITKPSGANTYEISHEAIENMPGGTNTPLDKVLLQAPGVSQDSAASGQIHIRNEHGNVSYRINGVLLPDGVSQFGQVLESSFIGSLSLLTGILPAQYGLRRAAVVDITTRGPTSPGTGSIGLYGGSHEQITTPSEYGGVIGKTEYFVVGRYWANDLGIENTTPAYQAIHDHTAQGKAFAYASTLNDDSSRTSIMTGWYQAKFQIPNNPGQPPGFTVDGVGPNDPANSSSNLNENQYERNIFGVIAWQKKVDDWDVQVAYVNRYASVLFRPDTLGDLVFNGVASTVFRGAFTNGIQTDAAYRWNDRHTIRTGFTTNAEVTNINNNYALLPVDPTTGNIGTTPFGVTDPNTQWGFLAGVYLQDEWRLTDYVTLNYGLRFDQMWQFVTANQVSPRINFVFKPWETLSIHAGWARYFTPPTQSTAAPTNVSLFTNTTQQPQVPFVSPVLPERGTVIDIGANQQLVPGVDVSIDGYYKLAHDLLDDGQFGQALVLTAFNYEWGENYGIESGIKLKHGDFSAYGNLAWGRQRGTNIVSNQYLFSADDLAFLAHSWIFTDHAQTWTGSAGIAYLWNGTRFTADMIYGSGLRSGQLNLDHVAPYGQVNVGMSREIAMPGDKPITVRFDVINLFDTEYEIRNGTGIGVFAPQWGPRRGYFVGVSQKL
ncbi:MAG: TonB-dependent receptor [Xanthobacteraceae bacterium]|nr:TonB-dependent receptor [Xanthobacteraceae bacterium]